MNNNVIEVDIKTKEGLFNPFNENQISEELGNYIFKNSKKYSTKSELIIKIDNKISFNEEEREHLVDAIREYFGLLVRSKLIYMRHNNIKKMCLFMVGVILILISDVISKFLTFVIPELFSIAGCVAIWEVVAILLFVDNETKFEIKKLKELAECEVKFNINE